MFEHDHHFATMNEGTRVRDEIRFEAPGRLGRLAEILLLREHLTTMLKKRNAYLQQVAETAEWHRYLDGQPELDMRVFQASLGKAGGHQYARS
jgi:hypothetical protein